MDDAPRALPRASLFALARYAPTFQRDPLRFFAALERRYGESVVFRIPRMGRGGERPLVVTSNRALLRQALTDERLRNSALALGGPRDSPQRRIRQSLFRMHGEEHRRHRKLVGDVLGKRAVERTQVAMLRAIDARLDGWRSGARIDLPTEMKDIARDIAASVLFGLDDLGDAASLGHQIEDWWAESFRFGPRVVRHPALPPTRRMLGKAQRLEARVRELIERKRDQASVRDGDLLARLVRARDEQGYLSEEALVGHAHMLFLAAHETTAYALCWTFVLLCLHPRIATNTATQIRQTLGGGDPGVDVLERCPQLHDVLRESQRLLPVVPFGARIAAQPLRFDELELPRGSRILLPFYRLHSDPRNFADPMRFRPERWHGPPPEAYTYLPFSAGPHMCIGVNFAMQTLALVTSRILQRFRMRIANDTRVDRRVTVTLAPRGPIPIELGAPDLDWAPSTIRGELTDMVDLSPTAD